ncbi:MAG: hypothetical protein J6P72_08780 [Firmicutes bacterium]|nr:hypothetical protein [Bacillota bacterium]
MSPVRNLLSCKSCQCQRRFQRKKRQKAL